MLKATITRPNYALFNGRKRSRVRAHRAAEAVPAAVLHGHSAHIRILCPFV